MAGLTVFLIPYFGVIVSNLMNFPPTNADFLKGEKEKFVSQRCVKHGLKIWHTADRMKILYIADSDPPLETPEARMLTQPQNSEETDLQTYFLRKEFAFVEMFLDDPDFAGDGELTTLPQHKWKRVLRHVATWMAEHKFLETDPRVFANLAELPAERYFQRVLYRQFPLPVIKDFHPIVQEACQRGLLYCLKLVHEYAVAHARQFNKYLNSENSFFKRQYGQLRSKGTRHSLDLTKLALTYAKKDFCAVQGDVGWTWYSGQKFEPFMDRSDLFEFRTTASYYLCNYTLTQKRLYEHLTYPGSPEAYQAYWGSGKYKALECLYEGGTIPKFDFKVFRRNNMAYTMATLDGFPCDRVGPCQVPIGGRVGRKRFDDEIFWDFSCAMLAFCPDVCCGAYKNPLDDPLDIARCTLGDADYPCRDGGQNDHCDYNRKTNSNFFDLIQNRINLTCGCNANEGKQWDSSLAVCLDVDECQDANPCSRDSEVCINQLNGTRPLCVCEFGYYRLNGRGQCVVDPDSGLFQNIDQAELRMKQLYGPIQEGKAPNFTLNGKVTEAQAVKAALGNIGAFLGRISAGVTDKQTSVANICLILTFLLASSTSSSTHTRLPQHLNGRCIKI